MARSSDIIMAGIWIFTNIQMWKTDRKQDVVTNFNVSFYFKYVDFFLLSLRCCSKQFLLLNLEDEEK